MYRQHVLPFPTLLPSSQPSQLSPPPPPKSTPLSRSPTLPPAHPKALTSAPTSPYST